MIKRCVLDVSEFNFSGHDIDAVVDFICTAKLCNIVIFLYMFVICTLCTMFIIINNILTNSNAASTKIDSDDTMSLNNCLMRRLLHSQR